MDDLQNKTILDASLLFSAAGINKQIKIDVYPFTYSTNYNTLDDVNKCWLYPAILSFKKYLDLFPKPNTFAIVGTGTGLDAIAANYLFDPKKTIIMDLHPQIPNLAKQNVLKYHPNKKIQAYKGDLCNPLIKNNIKVDLIYGNIPNIPTNDYVFNDLKTASYFNPKMNSDCPQKFKDYLLEHQYLLLKSAHKSLNKGGKVIAAIGGTMSFDLLEDLFRYAGFEPLPLINLFKEQLEWDEVLGGYSKYETKDIKFDFYDYEKAYAKIKDLNNGNIENSKLRQILEPYKMTATEAYNKYKSGDFKRFGKIAHLICGVKKE